LGSFFGKILMSGKCLSITDIGINRQLIKVSPMGEMKNAYNNVTGKPEGKRPLGRTRC
jgi:hypothetical protein